MLTIVGLGHARGLDVDVARRKAEEAGRWDSSQGGVFVASSAENMITRALSRERETACYRLPVSSPRFACCGSSLAVCRIPNVG